MYIYRYLIELYLFLVAVHLYANYSAVKALCLDTLNEDRLALIIKNYMMNERTPEPQMINQEESVFLLGNPCKILYLTTVRLSFSFLCFLIAQETLANSRFHFSQTIVRFRHKDWRFVCNCH